MGWRKELKVVGVGVGDGVLRAAQLLCKGSQAPGLPLGLTVLAPLSLGPSGRSVLTAELDSEGTVPGQLEWAE